jgi:hypothetical protein
MTLHGKEGTPLSLDLNPEIESSVREYAAAEGISIDDLLARHFPPRSQARLPRTSSTDAEKRAAVQALARMTREEIARLNAASIAHLQAKLDAAANATPEEIAQAEAEWDTHKQAMNENRRITGERPVYPEGPQR